MAAWNELPWPLRPATVFAALQENLRTEVTAIALSYAREHPDRRGRNPNPCPA